MTKFVAADASDEVGVAAQFALDGG